jgi:diguanylate cyclase (GGDEF)-like protein
MVPLAISASVNQQRMSARKVLRHAVRDAEAQRVVLEQLVDERTQQLHAANAQLESVNEQLKTASHTDPLTGLRNRRYLAAQIPADLSFYDREQKRTGRDDHALVFALVDVDHFKRINDTYGHKAGDLVLQQFAQVVLKLVRVGDYVVRWGGEEFLLVFRPVTREFVPVLAERVRRCVAENPFDIGDGKIIHVTCSIGLAEYPLFPGSSHGLGWEQMVELADAALYWVKHHGRDGWAALRPTPTTNMHELMGKLKEGAAPLMESGQLALFSSLPPEGRPTTADAAVLTRL